MEIYEHKKRKVISLEYCEDIGYEECEDLEEVEFLQNKWFNKVQQVVYLMSLFLAAIERLKKF